MTPWKWKTMTRIRHIKRITGSHNHRKCSSLQISFMHITSSGPSKVPEKLPEHTLVFFYTEKSRPRESKRHECPGAGLRWLRNLRRPLWAWSGVPPPCLTTCLLWSPTYQQKFWAHTWHQLGFWSHWPQIDLWIPSGVWSWFEQRGCNNTGDFHLYETKYCTKQLPRFLTHSSKVLP